MKESYTLAQGAVTTGSSPQDRYKAVWLIFFILGLGTLLPWNFFMTATLYFTSRLGESQNISSVDRVANMNVTGTAEDSRTYLQSTFNSVMTLCAMLPLLVFSCLNSFIHQRIPQQVRILCSLVAICFVFMVTAILVKVSMEPLPFFTITMIKIVFINSFGAILQGSLFGLAGLLPASYTTPIMSGQGLAGTFAALAMICAIASGSEISDCAFGYFITACVVILFAIGSYMVLPRLDFFRYYSMKDKTEYQTHENHSELDTKVDLIRKGEPNGIDPRNPTNGDSHVPNHKSSVFSIFRKIWIMALCVCLVFTITIGVFPAVTADVKTSIAGNTTWDGYFTPVSCFLVFNVFDWAGRSLTAVCMWPGKDSLLLPLMVIFRVIFIPLFMLCNVLPRRNLPVVFAHDAWYIIFMIFFSISNGYLASLCMCFGPKKVLPHEAETAGAIMAFFLSLGLALGAVSSFLFRYVI
ncbi:PREDICTED: equilibrative nucleoside transporter 1 [Gekko japonicus]|uniref:Equilibrative nucleoside transporter 1 n=1 Tax=Gekko japonicus TaxID=146911 RepID=A0ABM1KFB9_GEKJA|nr:PREDICTED: equilibrative nucleoside transporter 1 [Gekko japonicus]XP_015272402.1 PREDICTED: equilibrative nucleoside transporter 1 [Gekko japonicus]XP_015272403.1 PREDICTED: equilibrative nucleoside transporter 1 [Gekko japonicus]XP_015272404.1 PREDICTED: equilibrative nucleoside transporter 1 [Gekko japonicus]XP_015272405.1 PREDICTED: equilibrative nucleoside transporter 1 [Gekko japonicus]XP_015272406.1 PREDICTED: equilibrative nucleoside transporter 1 [Gekko japonicus]XP_015272407.1 PR